MLFDLQHNRERLYWLLQLSGWIAFVIINSIISLANGSLDPRSFLLVIYLAFVGICLTNVYRIVIKKRHWTALPYGRLIVHILLAAFIIAGITVSLLMLILLFTKILPASVRLTGILLGNHFFFFLLVIIWSLVYFTIHYVENFRTSEIEKLIWENAVKDFELKTLKSQLNPHFMFNAMNSIRALIEENPERAKIAITQLSNIFRYSLRIERVETVPLEDEIKVIEDYLALEQVRYEDRLKYKVEIGNETRRIEIPPMMIQTLVENGIKHGVSKLPQGGEVQVSAGIKDRNLIIEISNTGSFHDEDLKKAKGFGISNTKQRLHLLYGIKSSFTLKNENGKVLVKIIIPIGDQV